MYHLSIGTITDRIDLLDEHGIMVQGWEPVAGSVDATFSSSPLADYRRLMYYKEITTEETFPFVVKKSNQDDVITALQDLRRMCRLAMDYWVENWKDEPVYLAAQASCETNRRYAIVHSAGVPVDDNPHGQHFAGQRAARSVMVVDALGVERGPWCEQPPDVATCIEACNPDNYYCWPSYLTFDGVDDYVDCGSDAALDDIGAVACTVEAWVKADTYGENNLGMIVEKWDSNTPNGAGWLFRVNSGNGLEAKFFHITTDAHSASGTDEFSADGVWHHVALTYPHAGNTIKLYIDGAEVTSYAVQQGGVGGRNTDAAEDLYIGNNFAAGAYTWDGDIGWVRVSGTTWLYGADFEPPARCSIPEILSTTTGLWIVEGEGATTGNRADPAGTAGTISGAVWGCDCSRSDGRSCYPEEVCGPSYLTFDGAVSNVNCGDYAAIQDLPDDTNDFTVDAWVKLDGWGENNQGYICAKDNPPAYNTGWSFYVSNVNGLFLLVDTGGADGWAGSGTDEFSLDGEWHHVLGVVNSTGGVNATLYLAIDGVWVTSYSTRQNKAGAYGTDVGDDFFIGNDSASIYTFDGDIGWVRLSDTLLYTPGTNFTAPPRCTIPTPTTNTMGLWVHEGVGERTWDLSGQSSNYGAIDRAVWGCDCDVNGDPGTSCVTQPYIVNHLKTSGITHIYYDDGGAWSGNLQNAALPQHLLPPIPAVGDAVYFGCDTTLKDSGPFNNLVFDLATAQVGLTGQWEFYNSLIPVWTNMDALIQDNTDADGLMTGETFDTAGVASLHWFQNDLGNWGPEDLRTAAADANAPPVTAYWIRWDVTAIGAAPTAPVQQDRHVYTIAWPYVEVQDEDVPGDIAASMALEMFNESDHDGGTGDPILYTSRVITGLRSLERGADFVAYMNAADEQNPSFITFTKDAGWTYVSDLTSPTGRHIDDTIPGATTSDAGEWVIDSDYTDQFYGEYRAFVRGWLTAGTSADLSVQLELTYGYGRGSSALSDWVDNQEVGVIELYDMGRFVIPPTNWIKPSENAELGLFVRVRNNNVAARICKLYDIILMPVDEWAIDITGAPDAWGDYLSGNRSMTVDDWGGKGRYAYIDSITNPRYDLRVLSLLRDTGNFTGMADTIGNRPAILQASRDQRIWFLSQRQSNVPIENHANFEIAHSIQVYRQAHYLSMRGDR